VHAVWLDDEDMDILAQEGAGVITCPQSNLKLASGIARIQEMLDHNIPVGLGTDGTASNNSLDMFREMDTLAKIQKSATGRATAMTASDVMRAATTAGASIIGLDNCGEIKAGARADLILLNTRAVHLSPFYNQDLLVYGAAGSDVHTTIIDGKLIMFDRKIRSFDLDEVYVEITKRMVKI
jgi:5-methylthioadenosine/S-adenosylhomocysteine deaminase